MRVNTVQGCVSAGILPSTVLQRFRQRLDAIWRNLPPGYRYQFGGETEERDTAVRNLLGAVGIIVVLMGTTRVLSFKSFMAGIISVIVGRSIGLGLASLWVFGYPFGFMAIVGMMGLVGLAVNDAIVVLAALREHLLARQGQRGAMQDVVEYSTRHVLTTSVTTIAGFMPLLIAGGAFWPPLAIAIAGGIAGAMLLGLYFVPAAYLLCIRRRTVSPRQNPSAMDEAGSRRDTVIYDRAKTVN